jgi:hypothetical protein
MQSSLLSRFACTPQVARLLFWGWCVLGLTGAALYWKGGTIADRGIGVMAEATREVSRSDITFYKDVVAGVRAGGDYYDVAKPLLREYYQDRMRSTFNWRLPTYAYLFAMLGSEIVMRGVLLTLVAAAIFLNFRAEASTASILTAGATCFLLFLILAAAFQDPLWTQEVWAATLVSVSLGAWGTGRGWLAALAGCAALALRELVLPYCVVAGILAWWMQRRGQALAWLVGIAAFFVYLGWHHTQVQAQLAGVEGGAAVTQWLQFGGLEFLLLTGRMTNVFLFRAPGGIVLVLLWLALLGLLALPGERGILMLTTTLLYFGAFLVLGEPQNIYWGLFYAPMIPFGWSRGPAALQALYHGKVGAG